MFMNYFFFIDTNGLILKKYSTKSIDARDNLHRENLNNAAVCSKKSMIYRKYFLMK